MAYSVSTIPATKADTAAIDMMLPDTAIVVVAMTRKLAETGAVVGESDREAGGESDMEADGDSDREADGDTEGVVVGLVTVGDWTVTKNRS